MEAEFTFISPKPKLAKFLHEREPLILPSDFYHWSMDWVEDVGRVIRSREYKVSILATGATYAAFSIIARTFPLVTQLGIISEALGFKK